MPCATCCSDPKSRFEKTTRPPPGLTPRSPEVRPLTRPTQRLERRSLNVNSASFFSARFGFSIDFTQSQQHAIGDRDAGIDVYFLSPGHLEDKPLEKSDKRSGNRIGVQIAGYQIHMLGLLYKAGDDGAWDMDSLHYASVNPRAS